MFFKHATISIFFTILPASFPMAQEGPGDPAIDPIIEAMDDFRARGLDTFPMTMGEAADTLIDAATGKPVEGPWAYPGKSIEDPMLVGAPGMAPMELTVYELYEKPHPMKRIDRQVLVKVADQSTTPTESQITPVMANFLREALKRRRDQQSAFMIYDADRPYPMESVTWRAGLRDRLEEIIARTGNLSERLPDDPVIVDDSGPAFDVTPTGIREWVYEGEGDPGEWYVSYGPGLHIVEPGGAAAWIAQKLQPGRWAVWLHFDGGSQFTKNAELSFFAHSSPYANVTWNIDMSEEKQGFVRLGDWVASTSRPLRVELRSTDDKPAIADAILFEPLEFYSPIDREAEAIKEKLRREAEMGPTPTPSPTPLRHPPQRTKRPTQMEIPHPDDVQDED